MIGDSATPRPMRVASRVSQLCAPPAMACRATSQPAASSRAATIPTARAVFLVPEKKWMTAFMIGPSYLAPAPLASLLLGLVAVPLSRSSPRGGQQGGLPAAILLFAAYYNVSAIAKKLVAQGAIGVLPGVFWGQILLLVCLLLLNGRWLARWRRS